MRKLYRFVIFIIFLLLTPFAFAQTNISGGDVSGTWIKANSPYNINGEITIPNDSTLTIEPGVDVIFTGHYKFNVQGRLLAIGTESDTILFTINDTTGFHNLTIPDGGWGGIKLIDIDSSNDSTIIEYCIFQYGKSTTYGGAIYSTTDKLRISHCLFRNNLCIANEPYGGAIYISGSNPIIEYCEFYRNRAGAGDALYIWVSNDAIIRNNHFHHNSGSSTISINTSILNFSNNLIEQNHSSNCILSIIFLCQSKSGNNDEAINNSINIEIKNNTIVNNTCDQGGAILVYTGFALFINNIVYGNEPSQVNFLYASIVGFYNCLIEGGREGFTGAAFTGAYENCIDVDPQFVSSNDFHLQNTSPCIGSGIDSALINSNMYYCPSIDFEGNPRPNPSGTMPDIGAYENVLGSPLPVELISFTATATSKEVTLNWSTATELNNQGFEVQRKYGSNDFVTVGSVKGHGTTTSPNQYTFCDKLVDAGKYFYRLKQIDYNGTFEYSNEIEVEVRLLDKFNLEQNYPNPFNPTTKISWQSPVSSRQVLKVFDVLGNEIKTLVNEEKEAGYHSVDFNASELPSGVYFYSLQVYPTSGGAGSFTATKKLLLLK